MRLDVYLHFAGDPHPSLADVLEVVLRLEKRTMSNLAEVKADLDEVKKNLVETKDDLAEILTLNTQQTASIADLEAKLAALTAGAVITQEQLDDLGASAAELKTQSRAIADVVPENPVGV